ncbi:sirohydrochlorin chelatase [Pleurocapsales cyanobacterium LEGE 06147]|nr:sirohydrochlorin chelatase [Pleurocapsales cyanobacterium LEGE 06147]
MTSYSAYLLVSHGSRDSRARLALWQLTQLVRWQLKTNVILTQGNYIEQQLHNLPNKKTVTTVNQERCPLVSSACLELTTVPLHEQITQFARQANRANCQQIQIFPLFLLPGAHVREDIPAEVAKAQQVLGATVNLQLRPYLGSRVGMLELLREQFAQMPSDGRILLAHGSRIPGSNQISEVLAAQLKAIPAYWSVFPSLAEQIETLLGAGKHKIAILPYFLFSGKITEAIATRVQQLQQTFSTVELILGHPLGPTKELAKLVLEEVAQ